MSDPYLGEIRMFGGNYAPRGWALCDGRLLPISQYDALFALLSTTYGGDGQTTFGLPDLRGRVPIHMGQGPQLPPYAAGQAGGSESVSLTSQQTAAHNHSFEATGNQGTDADPTGRTFARLAAGDLYSSDPNQPLVPMSSAAIGPSPGAGQPHDNMMPYQCVNFIIALQGIFPPRD